MEMGQYRIAKLAHSKGVHTESCKVLVHGHVRLLLGCVFGSKVRDHSGKEPQGIKGP